MHTFPRVSLAGFAFSMTLYVGCGGTAPIAVPITVKDAGSGDINISDISSTQVAVKPTLAPPMLAPALPGTGIAVDSPVPRNPRRRGLVALDSSTHHFGEAKQNTPLQHDFVLKNNVEVPIRIVGMQSSCSCTWSESNDNFVGSTIESGHKVDFPMFINTATYQDEASGTIQITYRYESDDPKWEGEENLTLEVVATILPDYRIEPLELRFGEISALESQTAKRSFHITPVQMELLEIMDIKPSSDLFSVNILSSGKEGYEVEVMFDGSSLGNSEKVHGHLVIETNSAAVPRGLVSLSASYIAPIAIDQQYILVTSDEEGTVHEHVQITSSVPSQISNVSTSSSDLIHAEFDPALKSDEHTIAFSIDPCRDAEIDETIAVEMMLFPAGRECIIQTVPVTLYRFYKQGE